MQKMTPELKAAISLMSGKEKDKLLYRLIAKDAILTEKLYFQLVEMGSTMEERRNNLEKSLLGYLHDQVSRSRHPDDVLVHVKTCSGAITKHYKITSDNFGEVQLNFKVINAALHIREDAFVYASYRTEKFATYLVKKMKTLLGKMDKLHEDYYIEIIHELNPILELMHELGAFSTLARAEYLPKHFDY